MPLSEEEQRILRQIEEQLQRDPRFSRETRVRSQHTTKLVPLGFAALVCLVACILLIGISPYLAFAAFVACAVVLSLVQRRLSIGISAGATDLADGLRVRFSRPRDHH